LASQAQRAASAARFSVLLVDDGELDDVRDLLDDLGIEFAHLRGGAVPNRLDPPRDLFVTTMRRARLARAWPHSTDGTLRPIRIAVVEEDSSTARAALRRLGFSYLVRRPIHPAALRLLVLRALYRGDERRSDSRIPIGFDISMRSGLRRREALLVDLSRGGCRLVADRALPAGAKLSLHLPGELLGDGDLTVSGRILRCERDAQALADGGFRIAVRFQDLATEGQRALERFLARRDVRLGPAPPEPQVQALRPAEASDEPPSVGTKAPGPRAVLDRLKASRDTSNPPAAATSRDDVTHPFAREEAHAPPEPASLPGASSPADPTRREPPEPAPSPRLGAALISRSGRRGPPSERRRKPRGVYGRRVVAEAAAAMHRMLLGRDLGVGGMRVDAHKDLKVGSRLRLALYDPAREAPLVVDAVVSRDDGPRGLGLQFLAVSPDVAARLEHLVATLPPVEQLSDGEAGALGTVVGEIVA
jgi:hypothetical protein